MAPDMMSALKIGLYWGIVCAPGVMVALNVMNETFSGRGYALWGTVLLIAAGVFQMIDSLDKVAALIGSIAYAGIGGNLVAHGIIQAGREAQEAKKAKRA